MDNTTLTIVSASGAALLSAIGALWTQAKKRESEDQERYKAQQTTNAKQQDTLLEVTKEVGELKGRLHIAEEIKPKLDNLEALMNQVVEEVKDEPKNP